MKKKLLAIITAAAMLISSMAIAVPVFAADAETIESGIGTMDDPYVLNGLKYVNASELTDYAADESFSAGENEVAVVGYTDGMPADVVIPDKISTTGSDEKSVTIIDTMAFMGGDIENLLDFFNSGYSGNSKLESVSIPASVKSLGVSGVTKTLDKKYPNWFEDVSNMTDMNLVNALLIALQLGGGEMNPSMSSKEDFAQPDAVGFAFALCPNLKTVTIADGSALTEISNATFCADTGLREFTIPENVTTIGKSAFAASGLTEVHIPKTVTEIKSIAFFDCSNLSLVYFEHGESDSITLPSSNAQVLTQYYSIFHGCGNALVFTDNKTVKNYLTNRSLGANTVDGVYPYETPGDIEVDDQSDKIQVRLIEVGQEDNNDSFEIWLYNLADEEGHPKYVSQLSSIEFNFGDAHPGENAMLNVSANSDAHIAMTKKDLAASETRYVFYANPFTAGESEQAYVSIPATGLKLGTVTISGYGQGVLLIQDAIAYKEVSDSITKEVKVDEPYPRYTSSDRNRPAGAEIGDYKDSVLRGLEEELKNKLTETGGKINNINAYGRYDITEKTGMLEVFVLFPNKVEASDQDYSKMNLELEDAFGFKGDIPLYHNATSANKGKLGDKYDYTVTFNEDASSEHILASQFVNTDEATFSGLSNASVYSIKIENLPANNHRYNLVLTGDGYRTATLSGSMKENTSVFFWNNVMDKPYYVSSGKTASSTKNFLAGDIQMDGNIGLYDLNAVTSYYGKTDMKDEDGSLADGASDTDIQYDLNRDGKIDAKDIAYVLVSWGE